MKVKELRELVAQFPIEADEFEVIMSSHSEGNSFSPFYNYDVGMYYPDTSYSGELESYQHDEDGEELEDKPHVWETSNAVVLYPTN